MASASKAVKGMKKIYIISRFRANSKLERDFNIKVARHYAKLISLDGNRPVAPHLFYTQWLDDFKDSERALGLAFGIEDLRECDEFLLIVVDGYLSEGMRNEIAEVSRIGIRGRIIQLTKQQAREALRTVV